MEGCADSESIGGSDEADAVQDLAEVRRTRAAAMLLRLIAGVLEIFFRGQPQIN